MDLNIFLSEMLTGLNDFKQYWIENNQKNPEAFPMEFNEDNSGLWLEQFLMFLSQKE